MQKRLLGMLATVSSCLVLTPSLILSDTSTAPDSGKPPSSAPISSLVPIEQSAPNLIGSYEAIKQMLYQQRPNLREQVIEKVFLSLKCAGERAVLHNNILTVIDYSLPSSEKRLWVFDLTKKQLLFYTYVSHGIKSGTLLTRYFSNKNNSRASSVGVYTTEKPYYGRDGLSLRLDGLESGFNDNASNRSVVMHGGWYVEENFIKKYGRAGRSWGCPAVPLQQTAPIINTIKEKALFVAYYPNDNWFIKSKFLNCQNSSLAQKPMDLRLDDPSLEEKNLRDDVLFVERHRSIESDAILAMSADEYARIFQSAPPLGRMLRRQVNQTEFIALSEGEFRQLALKNDTESLAKIHFIAPVTSYSRGYNRTEMRIANLGTITAVKMDGGLIGQAFHYTLQLSTKNSVHLWISKQFIRWVGL